MEVADIQNTTREAFAKSLSRHLEDEFLDAEDYFENDGNDGMFLCISMNDQLIVNKRIVCA